MNKIIISYKNLLSKQKKIKMDIKISGNVYIVTKLPKPNCYRNRHANFGIDKTILKCLNLHKDCSVC